MTGASTGVVLAVVAGIVNGSFAAPTKYTRRWNWENIWAVWALVALFLMPWSLGLLTIPGLLGFYAKGNSRLLVILGTLGLGVGISQIFFGLALAAVGLSIGFAVTVGLSTAIGSVIPLILMQSSSLGTPRSRLVIAGVACMVVGTAICGVASSRQEEETRRTLSPNSSGDATGIRSFGVGLLLCILAGALSPLLNFGLVFGAPLILRAAQLGVSPANRTNVIWPPLLTATFIPYLAYCAHLWRKNRSWSRYGLPGTGHYWVFGTLMGMLWMGSLAIYGAASTRMQTMGPILGWPLFMSMIIITSNVWGFLTGEWRAASKKTVGIVLEGILFLILGFCVLAWSSTG